MVLFGSDSIDAVSMVTNTDDELIVVFCPTFKWIFNAPVINESVCALCSLIVLA
jgi:hypothetical protein